MGRAILEGLAEQDHSDEGIDRGEEAADCVEVCDPAPSMPAADLFGGDRCFPSDNLVIAFDRETNAAASRGTDLRRFIPLDPPWAWESAGDGDFVFWAFLGQVCPHHRHRPWLIIEECRSALGPVRFVLPRLAPECGWGDARAYEEWEETTWGEGAEPVAGALTLGQAVGRLPKSPTRPRWTNSERLIALAIRADIHGRRAVDIATEEGEVRLAGEPVRTIRSQIARGRRLLAEIGVLPWTALDLRTQPEIRHEWWRQPAFAEGLQS